MDKLSLGGLLKHKRTQVKLSARQLSLQAGLSAGYVSKVEAGDIMPSLPAFASIVKVLDCTKAEIVFMIGLAVEVKS